MSTEPLFSAEPPPRSGMSNSSKIFLCLGIGCGLLCLLICGGFFSVGYWAYSFMKNSTTTDPAVIRRLTADIVDIDIPQDLEPTVAIDIKNPFSDNVPVITSVVYSNKETNSHLLLQEFRGGTSDEKLAESIREQVRQALARNGHDRSEMNIEKIESETRELTIHGEPATFNVGKGTNRMTKDEVWRIDGNFAGKQGPARFTFTGSTATYSEEAIEKMLESMK